MIEFVIITSTRNQKKFKKTSLRKYDRSERDSLSNSSLSSSDSQTNKKQKKKKYKKTSMRSKDRKKRRSVSSENESKKKKKRKSTKNIGIVIVEIDHIKIGKKRLILIENVMQRRVVIIVRGIRADILHQIH